MAHPDALDLLVAPLPPDPELDTYCMMVPFSVEWVNWILRFQSWEVVRMLHTGTLGDEEG